MVSRQEMKEGLAKKNKKQNKAKTTGWFLSTNFNKDQNQQITDRLQRTVNRMILTELIIKQYHCCTHHGLDSRQKYVAETELPLCTVPPHLQKNDKLFDSELMRCRPCDQNINEVF